MCVCIYVYTEANGCLALVLCLILETESLIQLFLDCQPASPAILLSPPSPPCWGYMQDFHVGAGGSDLGPHAGEVNAITH